MYSIAPAILLTCLLSGSSVTGSELPPHRTVVNLRTIDPDVQRPLPVDPEKANITIGFLSSFKDFGKLIAGAIPLAVDMVNNDHGLLPHHNLIWEYSETGKPNTASTIKSMTEMREKGIVAFIGPDHSCVSEALVAAAWDMPMITYVVIQSVLNILKSPDVQDKHLLTTTTLFLLITSSSYQEVHESMRTLIQILQQEYFAPAFCCRYSEYRTCCVRSDFELSKKL